MAQDWNRNWFDASGRGIGFGIAREHAFQAEINLSLRSEAGVRGPQTRERLSNAAYGTFHGATADKAAGRAEGSGAVSVGEYLQIGDGIRDVLKGRRDTKGGTIGIPDVPLCSGGGGSRRNDSKGDIRVCSAEIAEESMLGCRG